MDIRRYKDLIAVKNSPDQIWGFHAHNLEIASLTPELWQALESEGALAEQPEIAAELNLWNQEISPTTQDAFDKSDSSNFIIKKLSMNIAQVCNLKCTYCAAGGDGTYGSKTSKIDLTIAQDQIRYFLNRFTNSQGTKEPADTQGTVESADTQGTVESETFHIQYIGGEPLLYPSIIKELSQFARLCLAGTKHKLAFSVTTNGTLITQKVARMLADFNFSVAVSLDGDADSNDATRPAKSLQQSSTAMTLNGLKELKKVEAELRALKVNSVFGSHNMNIVAAYEFLNSLDINWTEINFIYANNESDDEFSPLYISEMNKIAKIAYAKGGLTELAKIKQFAYVLSRLAAKTRIHSYCGAGKSLIQTDTRGDLYACNWFMNDPSEILGEKTSLGTIKLSAYEKPLITLNKCETCWSRHLCGGGCMAVHKAKTGDRHTKDPNFCTRTRELAAMSIHYYANSLEKN